MRGPEHRKRTKKFLGKEYPDVHEFVDAPHKKLGRMHRKERHGLKDVWLTFRMKGIGHAIAHLLHIFDDKIWSWKQKRKRKQN